MSLRGSSTKALAEEGASIPPDWETLLKVVKLVDIHLIDGTYELFRHYYALPRAGCRWL